MARTKADKKADSKTLAPVLPGEGKVVGDLVDEAVDDINRLYMAKGLETAKAVGDLVLNRFFAGDPKNFRDRANGHVSFRELGERDDLEVGWQFIWNAVAVVVQMRSLPAETAQALPLSHHKLLLSVKNEDDKLKLAKEAAEQNMGKRDLEDKIKAAKAKDDNASRAGRPPLPGFVKAFTALKKVVKTATEDEITEDSFEHFTKEQAKELLAEMEEQLEALGDVAARVRAHVRG
jgi:hypothetical protein